MTTHQVQNLTSAQQWAYLEDKLSKDNITNILMMPHEQEPPWTTLKTGWKLFNTSEKCRERIKAVQEQALHGLNITGADALKNDKESERTGVDMWSILGKK